ncbi:MAG: O-antigen ligase family protein [Kiritimatiellae bacterium]|nr:O-antigen ligase family protein [Kiritimatiellia bacterium]
MRQKLIFFLTALPVIIAPWFFGAWERWWFWGFALCIFAATFASSIDWLKKTRDAVPQLKEHKTACILIGSMLPFLLYAFVRGFQADVFMDAERSVLLFATPFLLGLVIIFGLKNDQRRHLLLLLICVFALLGTYGIVNHFLTGSKLVLWAPGYANYYNDGRASGSYFCPDHFAGIMELGFCLGIAYVLSRGSETHHRIPAACLCVLSVIAVGMSKSRGGGLTLMVVILATIIWGFSQFPDAQRWWHRISAIMALLIIAIVVWNSNIPYMQRFKAYFALNANTENSRTEQIERTITQVQSATRAQMISGALRAWRTDPVWGIGPGMHQNVWRRFAATPDGSREEGRWPSRLNNNYHSYEVHSDWVQLLEEYGLVGLGLFLIPCCVIFHLLTSELRHISRSWRRRSHRLKSKSDYPLMLGGLLALICMMFHSLGDFNLQMPATTWMLACILAVPLARIIEQRDGETNQS